MIPRFRASLFAVVATVLATAPLPLTGQQKVPLDHSVFDGWNRISARAISNDGRWVLYRLSPGLGDSELHVRNIESGRTFEINRGNAARFSQDSRFVVFEIQPVDSIVKDLRLEDTRQADLPKDSLGILDLASGGVTRIERVKSFGMPEEAGGWVAYLVEAPAGQAPQLARRPTRPAKTASSVTMRMVKSPFVGGFLADLHPHVLFVLRLAIDAHRVDFDAPGLETLGQVERACCGVLDVDADVNGRDLGDHACVVDRGA